MGIVLVIVILAIVIGAIGLFVLVGSLFGLALHLLVAGVVGLLADKVVPGKLPYGFLGAIAAGVIGGFLGGLFLRDLGPSIAGVRLVPTFVGAAALAFGLELYNKAQRGERF
jgi:uncharacterized membrane protein YeaQ/YmgE (transglycosylase-associated protein family)